ncbi:signal peptide protein [Paenibacillus chartarius]|uniref:Signal peptide protein n=1 Tax=Paenibacillus chartarius TaxID=747481 RepID=A0ABV6DK86_9BACL
MTVRTQRIIGAVLIGVLVIIIIAVIAGAIGSNDKGKLVTSTSNGSRAGSAGSAANDPSRMVPWDYKVEQKKVGDLIGADMTILPENELMPNDDSYATGDTVWVLSAMNAVMTTQEGGKNDVTLTAWKPIKTFKKQDAAQADLTNLKEQVQTDVDLVGVYKTELDGKFRHFAVIQLPSGQAVKQPIDEARYNDFKPKKQVKVTLEVVHDFTNYDQAFPKFRGWAS